MSKKTLAALKRLSATLVHFSVQKIIPFIIGGYDDVDMETYYEIHLLFHAIARFVEHVKSLEVKDGQGTDAGTGRASQGNPRDGEARPSAG